MKVKAFAYRDLCVLEREINEFIRNEEIMVINIKFSTSQAFRSDIGYMDFCHSALIIYEEGICNE